MQETQETQVQSLGWYDPLEKEMLTHSSILAWKIPWTEEPGGLQSRGRKESDTTKWLNRTELKAIRLDKITKEVTIGRREGGQNTELGAFQY